MAYERLRKMAGKTNNHPRQTVTQNNWQGVNYVDSEMSQGQVPFAQNVDFGNPIGDAAKRGGLENLFTSLGAGGIKGLHNFKHSSGEVFLLAHDTKLYRASGGSGSTTVTTTGDFLAGTNMNTYPASNNLTMLPLAASTFARNSTKYDSAGAEIAIDTPSYEDGKFAHGVHMEEGTTNLLTANQASVETDLTGLGVYSGATITRDTTEKWQGTASMKVVTNGVAVHEGAKTYPATSVFASTTYTGSAWVKVPAGATIQLMLSDWVDKSNAVTITGTGEWQRYSVTITTDSHTTLQLVFQTVTTIQAITFYVDGLQIEQKAYATSFQLPGTARVADSLYYTPTNPLADDWFVSGFWKPDFASTVASTDLMTLLCLYADASNGFYLWYDPTLDKLQLTKAYDGITADVSSVTLTFSAGSVISFAVAHVLGDYGDIASGMHLWYKIDSGAVVHRSSSDSVMPTSPTKVYVGCNPDDGSLVANGVIDAVKLVEVANADDASITVNNTWAEAHLTATTAPAADLITVLMAQMDDALTCTRSATGVWMRQLTLGYNTLKTATLSWNQSTPAGTSVNWKTRSSTKSITNSSELFAFLANPTWTDWHTVAVSGDAATLGNVIEVRIEFTGTDAATATVNDFTVAYTTDFTATTEVDLTPLGRTLTGNRVRFADWDDNCSCADGERPFLVYMDGATAKVRALGVDPPTTAPTIAAGASTGLTGDYYAKVTYVNDDDIEGNPSSASAKLTVANQDIAWSAIPTGPTGTAKRKLYRTKAGGSVYYYVATISDNTTTTYTDATADASLLVAMDDDNNIPPDATIVYEFMNYMMYVYAGDESQLWISKVGSPEQVQNITGSMNYKQFSGPILGIESINNALVVHGGDFVDIITATGGFIFDPSPTVDTTIIRHIDKNGALSQESIAICVDPELRQIMVFPTQTGVRFLMPGLQDESLESVPLSRNIQPYFDRSVNRYNMAACFYNNYYLLAFTHQEAGATAAGSNNVIFAFDYRNKQWYGPWTIEASCFAVVSNYLFCGCADTGKVYQMFTGSSDDGAAIEIILDLPVVSPNGIEYTYRFPRFLVEVSAGSTTTSTTVAPKIDDSEATVSLGTLSSSFTGTTRPGHDSIRSKKYQIPLPAGHALSHRISDSSTNPLSIQSVITEYEVLGLRT